MKLSEAVWILPCVVLLCSACSEDSSEMYAKIEQSLLAEPVLFVPVRGDGMELNQEQAKRIRSIASQFLEPEAVTVQKELLGYLHGEFVLGSNRFAWQGNILYFRTNSKRFHVIRDNTLGNMSRIYLETIENSSTGLPDKREWIAILSVLEQSE